MIGDSILVVDDNTDAANAMGKLLKLIGFPVSIAYSGQEALVAVSMRKPRVVLLDIRMPEMDGYDVARALRQDKRFADVVLVALTGFGQEEDKSRAQAAGFDHHLTKPASLGDLKDILDLYI